MSDLDDGRAEQLVAHRDAGTGALVLTGWAAGPAGWASVSLGGGEVDVFVDHAEPSVLARLVVAPDADPRDARSAASTAVAALLPLAWPDVVAALDDLDDRPRVVWSGTRYGRATVVGGTLARVGRLAVLDATVDDLADRAAPADRAALVIAALESGVQRADLLPALRPDPSPLAMIATAGAALLALDVDELRVAAGWRGRLELAALVEAAAAALRADDGRDALADGLVALARDLRGQPDTGVAAAVAPAGAPPVPFTAAPAAAPAAMAPTAAARGGARRRVPRPALERARAEEPIHVEVDPALADEVLHATVADAHVRATVRLTGEPRARWLRAFRLDAGARRPVLLGLAPVVPTPFGTGTATVLVPAGLGAARLVADLTDRPEQAWRRPSTAAITRAIRRGRAAGAAERRGDADAAEAAWLACAAGWTAIGDDRRAELGRRHAGRTVPAAPFVVDRLR